MSRLVLLVTALVTLAACGADTGTSPSPIESKTMTEQSFSGTLDPRGLRFYSFTATDNTSLVVLLGNVSTGSAPAAATQIGLGVGTPAGTGCAVRESTVTPAALTSQLRTWVARGIHCVAVYDTGTLTEPVSFALRFSYY